MIHYCALLRSCVIRFRMDATTRTHHTHCDECTQSVGWTRQGLCVHSSLTRRHRHYHVTAAAAVAKCCCCCSSLSRDCCCCCFRDAGGASCSALTISKWTGPSDGCCCCLEASHCCCCCCLYLAAVRFLILKLFSLCFSFSSIF